MLRRIITIDEEKCNGCGLCTEACHEKAIIMVNGKAKLIKDDYCDGLGDCLPHCPTDAISFVTREAAPYDEAAVKKRILKMAESPQDEMPGEMPSALQQWPVQLELVSIQAPFLQEAHLLVAADCTAYAYGDFHRDFIKDKVVLLACPKLDDRQYIEKLSAILAHNNIRKITVVRMEVPCCQGIAYITREALNQCGKDIPLEEAVISIQGEKISVQ